MGIVGGDRVAGLGGVDVRLNSTELLQGKIDFYTSTIMKLVNGVWLMFGLPLRSVRCSGVMTRKRNPTPLIIFTSLSKADLSLIKLG